MFEELWNYEIAMPGSISGEGEIDCPNCGTSLVVPVEDPNEKQSYQCQICLEDFVVDWARV